MMHSFKLKSVHFSLMMVWIQVKWTPLLQSKYVAISRTFCKFDFEWGAADVYSVCIFLVVCGFLWFKYLKGVDTNEGEELFIMISEPAFASLLWLFGSPGKSLLPKQLYEPVLLVPSAQLGTLLSGQWLPSRNRLVLLAGWSWKEVNLLRYLKNKQSENTIVTNKICVFHHCDYSPCMLHSFPATVSVRSSTLLQPWYHREKKVELCKKPYFQLGENSPCVGTA